MYKMASELIILEERIPLMIKNKLKAILLFCILSLSSFASVTSLAVEELIIEDWLIMCSGENNSNCMMTQTIVNPESEGDLLGLAIGFYKNKTSPTLAINLPPQLDPQQKPVLVIGSSETGRPFTVDQCDTMRCSSTKDLPENTLNQMKRADDGYVLFNIVDGSEVKVHFSLNGFNDAYRYIVKKKS